MCAAAAAAAALSLSSVNAIIDRGRRVSPSSHPTAGLPPGGGDDLWQAALLVRHPEYPPSSDLPTTTTSHQPSCGEVVVSSSGRVLVVLPAIWDQQQEDVVITDGRSFGFRPPETASWCASPLPKHTRSSSRTGGKLWVLLRSTMTHAREEGRMGYCAYYARMDIPIRRRCIREGGGASVVIVYLLRGPWQLDRRVVQQSSGEGGPILSMHCMTNVRRRILRLFGNECP